MRPANDRSYPWRMKKQSIAFLAVIGIGAVASFGPSLLPKKASQKSTVAAVNKQKTTQPAELSDVEKMKKCASDALVARMRWFYEETGVTTTKYSGAAQRYADQMRAAGLQTKTPIPTPNCG